MLRFFRHSKPTRPPDPLDQAILAFSESDGFTIRDSFEGVQIFGGIGSGKTSGSGAHLATSFLRAGYGGLVLTAKPDEPELWRAYARETDRTNDLVFFGPNHPHRFNALRYECSRQPADSTLTENIVELFDTLTQVAGKSTGQSGGENQAFWRNEQQKLVRNAVDLLRLAREPIDLPAIHKVVDSAPVTVDMLKDPKWQKVSFFYNNLLGATTNLEEKRLSPIEQEDFKLVWSYWTREYPTQAENTRSNFVGAFTGMTGRLLRGLFRELFSADTTLTPEDTFDGKIIVLDMPQKRFNEVGVYAQVLFKYCWQRAVERRAIAPASRPVFLWIDEAQHFVNEHDVAFQTTARSSRVATVLLTQNLPNYLHVLGGRDAARSLVDSLLGNLTTKVFHNNTCAQTNQFAADLFAKGWQERSSLSYSRTDGKDTFGTSTQSVLEYTVIPRDFTGLKKGGPPHDFMVEAIIHQGGRTFAATGTNALLTAFPQRRC